MPAISIQFRRDRKAKPWVVRYGDGPSHRSSSFRTMANAQLFAARLRTDQASGEWVLPDAGRSPATAEKALRTMSAAVDARLIRDNPCRGVRPPRAGRCHEPRFLTPAEVEVLAGCVRPPYDLLVRFTAYTSLRWGEVAALRA